MSQVYHTHSLTYSLTHSRTHSLIGKYQSLVKKNVQSKSKNMREFQRILDLNDVMDEYSKNIILQRISIGEARLSIAIETDVLIHSHFLTHSLTH